MDFLFTFRDGSKALAHHGVEGMKWDVHNFGEDMATTRSGILEAVIDLFGSQRSNPLLKSVRKIQFGGSKGGKF